MKTSDIFTDNVDASNNSSPAAMKHGAMTSMNQTPIQVIARVRPQIKSEFRHPICLEVIDDSVVDDYKTQIMVKHGFENEA